MSGARLALPLAILAIAAASLAAGLRAIDRGTLSHPDEVIAAAGVDMLRANPGLDTNWKNARLPDLFRRSQYNFSGYLVALFGATRAMEAVRGWPPEAAGLHLDRLRKFSAASAAIALLMVGAIAASSGSRCAALVAVALAAASPSLVMDGFYARPDAFATLLALALLLVFVRRERFGHWWIALAGGLLGLLVSVKVSFVWYSVLLLPAFLALPPWGLLIASAAAFLGFAAGAPGALANPDEYVSGMRFLLTQYGSEHWPHGLGSDAAVHERLAFSGRWLVQTWGFALPLVLLGLVAMWRGRQWRLLQGLSPFAITAAYFMATPVFFERNLSPALAAFAIVSGIGVASLGGFLHRRHGHAAGIAGVVLAAAFALAIPLAVTAKVFEAVSRPDGVAAERAVLERRLGAKVAVLGWIPPSPARTELARAKRCGSEILEIYHAGDPATLRWLGELTSRDWIEVSRKASVFADLAPSTFHTYLSANVVWLQPRPQDPAPCIIGVSSKFQKEEVA